MYSFNGKQNLVAVAALCVVAVTALFTVRGQVNNGKGPVLTSGYIVQGLSVDKMTWLVERIDGEISHALPIIQAIGAQLTPVQYDMLAANADLIITPNRKVVSHGSLKADVEVLPSYATDTHVAEQSGASFLHQKGITGDGVGVAIIDSGLSAKYERGSYLRLNGKGRTRLIAKYDAIEGKVTNQLDDDFNGHGSHIGGVIASSVVDKNGNYNGMAPDANLISIKAFNEDGEGSYLDVIAGIEWMIEHKDRLNVRVANLSFGAQAQSRYWEDPLNQAVMRAWKEGIVVVTSAGNQGPVPMSITAPGNIPYVITVGALNDNYTPNDISDDRMTSFSSQGPTFEGFAKPDLVSWGGHVIGKINPANIPDITQRYDLLAQGEDYYMISGTSQAAAVITGTVALMFQLEPGLTPDDVKCRLINSAEPGYVGDVSHPEFIEGAGLSNAVEAVLSHATGCANAGMNLSADIAGTRHYQGPVRSKGKNDFYVKEQGVTRWQEAEIWSDASNRKATLVSRAYARKRIVTGN